MQLILWYHRLMKILVTNDDGIDAAGLKALVKAMAQLGEVYVVAPDGERSSNSHHLNIKGRIRFEQRSLPYAKKAYAIWGTPADCAHMGLYYFFEGQIDLVVSGINKGANVSTDIIYSGTIAAAREAYLHHVPAMAVSLDSFVSEDYDVCGEYALKIARQYMKMENRFDYFLNVNVPALEKDEIKGIRVCDKEGDVHYRDTYTHIQEEGKDYIVIGPCEISYEDCLRDLDVDVEALKNAYVSLSALHNSHVDNRHNKDLEDLLKNIDM